MTGAQAQQVALLPLSQYATFSGFQKILVMRIAHFQDSAWRRRFITPGESDLLAFLTIRHKKIHVFLLILDYCWIIGLCLSPHHRSVNLENMSWTQAA